MKKNRAKLKTRSEAVRFAVANTEIEGGHVLPETRQLLEKWERGQIDDDRLTDGILKKFGPNNEEK